MGFNLSTSQTTLDAATAPNIQPNRNLLHNGAMQVAQRGTSVAGLTGGGYATADRWWLYVPSTLGTWTQSIEADAPTGSGFRKSLKMLVTTAQASPAAGAIIQVTEVLEGQDLQRITKGTSSAQQLTLSFWVKSNAPGTYIANLYDYDNNRQVSASYAISASATWERKVITFPADTTGAFDNDNAASMSVSFILGAGSTYTSGSLQTTWATNTAANTAPGQTNLAAATNNYWQVTGVQLEVGPSATDFEFEPYGETLRKCQRYYYRVSPAANDRMATGLCRSATQAEVMVPFPGTMRIAPTALEQSGTAGNYGVLYATTGATCSAVPTYLGCTTNMADITVTVASGLTAGQAAIVYAVNTSGYLAWSADL